MAAITTIPLWIDNEPVESDSTFLVTNSETGQSLTAYGATRELVERAIESSHRAFASWRHTSPWQRRELLSRAGAAASRTQGLCSDYSKGKVYCHYLLSHFWPS